MGELVPGESAPIALGKEKCSRTAYSLEEHYRWLVGKGMEDHAVTEDLAVADEEPMEDNSEEEGSSTEELVTAAKQAPML